MSHVCTMDWRAPLQIGVLLIALNSASAQDIDPGRYYALLIANEGYRHWTPLKTPHEDVDDLAKILRIRYRFADKDIKILKDVTRDDIIDELENLKGRLTARDNLLIYYAGHGKIRDDGGYWIGLDAKKTSRSRWLHHTTISDLIDVENGMSARHVLVIADSCYSGAALREEEFPKKPLNESRASWLDNLSRKRARTILTAGGVQPVLDRVGTSRHSIFALELLRHLNSNQNVLEGSALHGLIKEEVHSRARRQLGRSAQAPEYGRIPGTGHGGGEFLFFPKDVRIAVIDPRQTSDPFGIRRAGKTERTRGTLGPEMVFVRANPPFLIGRYEVSFEEYDRFASATGSKVLDDESWGRGKRPVINVSWDDAVAYAQWLSQKTGKNYRLPTEDEWAYAARAGTKTAYWWGKDIRQDDKVWANCDDCGSQWDSRRTAPVGSFPANPFGLHDTAGNVWEWVQDCYSTDEGRCGQRVIRGGSWLNGSRNVRSSNRNWNYPDYRRNDIGFRLAQDLE